jgi:hypothetical protein
MNWIIISAGFNCFPRDSNPFTHFFLLDFYKNRAKIYLDHVPKHINLCALEHVEARKIVKN